MSKVLLIQLSCNNYCSGKFQQRFWVLNFKKKRSIYFVCMEIKESITQPRAELGVSVSRCWGWNLSPPQSSGARSVPSFLLGGECGFWHRNSLDSLRDLLTCQIILICMHWHFR